MEKFIFVTPFNICHYNRKEMELPLQKNISRNAVGKHNPAASASPAAVPTVPFGPGCLSVHAPSKLFRNQPEINGEESLC